jgi:hypothetical protein
MVKRYTFNYFNDSASVEFLIDTDIVTREQAKESVEYYKLSNDDPELYEYGFDIYTQLMQYYALQVIINASIEYADLETQKKWFNQDPGLLPIDGSQGIELLSFTKFNFYDKIIRFEIEQFNNLTFKKQ